MKSNGFSIAGVASSLKLLALLALAGSLAGCWIPGNIIEARKERALERAMSGSERPTHLPRIPAPAGFVEASVLGKETLEDLGHFPPECTHLGTYLPTNVLADLLNKGSAGLSPCCRILFLREFPTGADADNAFQRSFVVSKQDEGKSISLEGAAAKDFAGAKAAVRGVVRVTDSLYTVWMTAAGQATIDNRKQPVSLVVYSGCMRLKDQLLMVIVRYPMSAKTDVQTCKKTTLDWVEAIEQLNAARPPPR
jgi:hypothetical protein